MTKIIIRKKQGPTPPKPDSNNTIKKKQLNEEGKRWVDFVIKIETWEKFKILICKKEKPSAVLINLIEDAIREGEV
jgi:hypothetical protein